jgi:hypothetical protein
LISFEIFEKLFQWDEQKGSIVDPEEQKTGQLAKNYPEKWVFCPKDICSTVLFLEQKFQLCF